MRKAEAHPGTMPFALRPLREADIPQSSRIERDAFPSSLPPTSFSRELKNRLASYLVAWERDDVRGPGRQEAPLPGAPKRGDGPNPVGALLQNARDMWNARRNRLEEGHDLIVGFLGAWYASDEAHIVSVGVRRDYRGRGVGELLLLGAIEQAFARRASVLTLEVRASNQVAIHLYRKYGFRERGVRKDYYQDNREDAMIMTTDPIRLPPFTELFRQLRQDHRRRWGFSESVLE